MTTNYTRLALIALLALLLATAILAGHNWTLPTGHPAPQCIPMPQGPPQC